MLQKIKFAFLRFMQGRYGIDKLNTMILYTSIFLSVFNLFLRSRVLIFINDILIIIFFYRAFSKNYGKRYRENQLYTEAIKPYERRIECIKRNKADKEHKYYVCPNCSRMVRVPSGRGKIEIKCPTCYTKFVKKS